MIDELETDRYQPFSVFEQDEVDAVKCTWCGHWALLGVPIAHADDCKKPEANDGKYMGKR